MSREVKYENVDDHYLISVSSQEENQRVKVNKYEGKVRDCCLIFTQLRFTHVYLTKFKDRITISI